MKRSKLIDFLQSFGTRDFRRFREYLDSPYFNKREDVRHFYSIILESAPDFPAEMLQRHKLWQRYAGDRPFDGKELNYVANFLLQHAENFVATEKFQHDATTKNSQVLAHCIQHGLDKHYRSAYQRAQKALKSEPHRDAEWHLKAWRLADAEMQRFYTSRSRRADPSINAVVEHLDTFYLDKKLELSSEILNLNQILSDKFDTSFIKDLKGLMETRKSSESIIEIRKLILNILMDPEDLASFHQLRELLPLARRIYPSERVAGIFSYAQNFCIRRIKAGDAAFEKILFRIYKESIESKVMFVEGTLIHWDLKNVCSIALKLKEFKWVEEFINEHEHSVAEEFRQTAIAYNRANLYFHQERFDLALRSLNTVEFTDVFYALDTRRLMLMIYFKRHESEALFSLISSFRTFLNRNRVISEPNRRAYRNFINWAARIYRLSTWEHREQRPKLVAELAATPLIVGREWLMDRLDDHLP